MRTMIRPAAITVRELDRLGLRAQHWVWVADWSNPHENEAQFPCSGCGTIPETFIVSIQTTDPSPYMHFSWCALCWDTLIVYHHMAACAAGKEAEFDAEYRC